MYLAVRQKYKKWLMLVQFSSPINTPEVASDFDENRTVKFITHVINIMDVAQKFSLE